MIQKINIGLVLIAGIFIVSCGKDDPTPACTTTGLTYTKDIKTLFSGCGAVGCHNSGALVGSYANYADTKATLAGAAKTRIIGSLKQTTGFSAMPKGGTKFSDCEISKVEAWIAAGMPE